jgi:hypothetical protein
MGPRVAAPTLTAVARRCRSLVFASSLIGLCADAVAFAAGDEASSVEEGTGTTAPHARAECFPRAGATYVLDDWELFRAISANDVVAFARKRHAEIEAEFEDIPEGSYRAERLRDQIKQSKVYVRELSSTRARLRDAVFVAADSDTFGLEHLGHGRFFLYVAGGAADSTADMLVQGRMHDDFTMATMRHYRKRLDQEGPLWGLDLVGMPNSVKEGIEEKLDHGWTLRWRWKGLAVPRSSWILELDAYGRLHRAPVSIYALGELSIDLLDEAGVILWTVD